MKTAIVMEGGALRGLFTCGVIDVLMENGISFDGGIGVSAGATFGCNIKSKQIGRPLRYNKKYAADKRYKSISSWLRTGDLFGVDFCYDELPYKLELVIRPEEALNINPLEKDPWELDRVYNAGRNAANKLLQKDSWLKDNELKHKDT